LPQNPDESWRRNFDTKKPLDWVYRLGNTTPLEPDLNSALGRAGYEIKRETFSKSAYAITQQVKFESWSVNAVAYRQEQMAEMAVQIWCVEYD